MIILTILWICVAMPLTTRQRTATPVRETAAVVLAKASAAYEQNRLQEIHWNWVTHERRAITGKDGQVVQTLPEVTVESIIRSDGKRCAAVQSWGDGTEPYLLNSDPDARCQATDPEPAMTISALLKSHNVKIASRTASEIQLSVSPDKKGLNAADVEQRCAASLRATVHLDPASYFPRLIEGSVVETGCDRSFTRNVYYDQPGTRNVRASIHKGTTFRVEYELQQDKFGAPEHNFWIEARRHNDILRWFQGGNFISWGRVFPIVPDGPPQHVVEDIETSAQEFGAQSIIR